MMKRARVIIVVATLITGMVSIDAAANARDPDGSRMQARQLSVGSSASDRLNPPRDSVDWHYFKLRDAKEVKISLSTSPSANPARLRITNAVGKSVSSTSTRSGKASIARRLDPGVYYVSVNSGKPLKYTLSVQ